MIGARAKDAPRGRARALATLLDRTTRGLVAASIVLQVLERMALAWAAISAFRGGLEAAAPIAVALAVLGSLRGYLRLAIAARSRRMLAAATSRALLRRNPLAPCAWEAEGGEGLLSEAMLELHRLLVELAPSLVADAIACVGVAALAAIFLPTRFLAAASVAVILVAVLADLLRRRARRALSGGWDAYAPLFEGLTACVGGSTEIVGNGSASAYLGTVRTAADAWAAAMVRGDAGTALVGRVPAAFGLLLAGLLLYLDETSRGIAPLTAIGHAFVLVALLPPFASAARSSVELVRARTKTRALEDLLATPRPARSATKRPTLPSTIRWADVSYAYPLVDGTRGPEVVTAFSATWEKGESIALAGPNGAGKSTLLRLLLGLDEPTSGSIRVGDASLSELDLDAFRSRVAFVSQRPFFPRSATIRGAVRFLVGDASDDAIASALERVGLLTRLKMRHTDPLSVEVATLSYGERQRVAIARALVRDADILLFDEPDANLDAGSVSMLRDLLRDLAKTKMVAFVAHDPAILQAAEKIVMLGEPTRR